MSDATPPDPSRYPGQPPTYPPQPYGAQAYPGQPYPGQPYPGQAYGAQPGYGQPYGPPAPYAHWGLRLAAYLLDAILLFPAYFIGGIGRAMYADYGVSTSVQNTGLLLAVLGYGFALAFAIWNQILRQGRTGASLGKKWVGIKVVRESDGQPLGPLLTFGRALLHVLDALPCYLGYLWPLWDAKRQTFADKLVRSVVLPHQAQYVVPAYPGAAPPPSW